MHPPPHLFSIGSQVTPLRHFAVGVASAIAMKKDLQMVPCLSVERNIAVGFDNFDLGVIGTNRPGVLTEITADLVFGLLLTRRQADSGRRPKNGQWYHWTPSLMVGRDVHGSTAGIFGMGRIELAVGRRVVELRNLHHNRSRNPEAEAAVGASYLARWPRFYRPVTLW